MRPDPTQDDIDAVTRLAYRAKRRWPWSAVDVSDFEHDALYGLYKAWENWRGESQWEPYRDANIWWAMRRATSKRLRRHELAPMDVAEPEDPRLVDAFEEAVMAKLELEDLQLALMKELPVVRDAVLRSGSDAEIARRHGRADGGSIRQYRKRFLARYVNMRLRGEVYRSNGRRREPRGAKLPSDDHLDPGSTVE